MTDDETVDPDGRPNERLNIGLNLKFNKKNEEVKQLELFLIHCGLIF